MRKLLAVMLCAVSLTVGAQTTPWPDKAVTIVVPFPAGGSTDMVARAMALQMGSALGQSFIVDNKPGATGTIGAGVVKRVVVTGATEVTAGDLLVELG